MIIPEVIGIGAVIVAPLCAVSVMTYLSLAMWTFACSPLKVEINGREMRRAFSSLTKTSSSAVNCLGLFAPETLVNSTFSEAKEPKLRLTLLS